MKIRRIIFFVYDFVLFDILDPPYSIKIKFISDYEFLIYICIWGVTQLIYWIDEILKSSEREQLRRRDESDK